MKALKFIIPVAGLLLASATVSAQTVHETNQIIGSDLNGTARFVGMGGAMGALGGDISTMGTNPAGIGIYRSSDMNISFGFSNVGNKATHGALKNENDKFFGSFDNVGFVIALKQGNHTPVRFVNFGFNYRKLKSFDRNVSVSGDYNASQTQQFADMANTGGYNWQELSNDPNLEGFDWPYGDRSRVPWLAAMAYNSFLIPLQDGFENRYDPYFRPGVDLVLGDYNSTERGAVHSYNFNFALNLYDRFYLGGTLGVYDLDYRKHSTYSEVFDVDGNDEGYYKLTNRTSLDGTGVDFKLGAIWRPFESSPFRVGLAVHTPTFYNITARQGSRIDYDVFETDNSRVDGIEVPHDPDGYDYDHAITDYKLVTPWKYNVSLGYTIGSNIALGAEYEYMDYSTSKLKYDDGVKIEDQNSRMKNMLKGVHAIRLGAEFRVAPQFSLRAGYNHITSSTYSHAFNDLPSNSIRTDTEYFNSRATNNYTLGFGYRGEHFYADMAYQYNNFKEDFYAFDNKDLKATDISNNRHQVLFTLGMRF